MVKMLVDTGIDIDEDDGDDSPLLHVAACHSRPDIVQFLINRGANTMLLSARYGTPLIAALEGTMAPFLRSTCQPESCRSLAMDLPRPTPPRESYVTMIYLQEIQGKPGYKKVLQCEQIVRILFDEGAEVDTTIRSFGNALHLASYMGSEVIVCQLLERMEDINIIGGYFESPLIAGLKGDYPAIVDLLLDRGSDVNQILPEHGSALHYACGHGSQRLIQSLLDHGANINAYDDKHGSVLAAALFRRLRSTSSFDKFDEQCAIVELLLRHEPKVQIRDCDLLAAASQLWGDDREHFMRLLFRHDASIVATEAVIVKIIQNQKLVLGSSPEDLRLVLQHDGGRGTTPAMVEAIESLRARNLSSHLAKVTEMLLEHQPLNQATADKLKSLSEK